MKYMASEQQLRSRMKKRRVIEAVVTAVFLVILIVFVVLYEQSRAVEEISFGPIKHQTVTYNTDFLWGILVGAMGSIFTGIWLITDLVFSRVNSFAVLGDGITLYRGLLCTVLYVNGEERDRITHVFSLDYYLEASLSDGTKMTAALGRWSAHFTFSNGLPPIDVYILDGSDVTDINSRFKP